jgi:hypothetical protein
MMRSRLLGAEPFEEARQTLVDRRRTFPFDRINFLMNATVGLTVGFIHINCRRRRSRASTA